MSQYLDKIRAYEAQLPTIRAEGVEALMRLVKIALTDTGQARHVAVFLLSLYNGYRFKMDLGDFRGIDTEIFNDCMKVLRMDHTPQKGIHEYVVGGEAVFEKIAHDWNVTDYYQIEQKLKNN